MQVTLAQCLYSNRSNHISRSQLVLMSNTQQRTNQYIFSGAIRAHGFCTSCPMSRRHSTKPGMSTVGYDINGNAVYNDEESYEAPRRLISLHFPESRMERMVPEAFNNKNVKVQPTICWLSIQRQTHAILIGSSYISILATWGFSKGLHSFSDDLCFEKSKGCCCILFSFSQNE